jgi:transcriptional regulator with XRE-family HTH domain
MREDVKWCHMNNVNQQVALQIAKIRREKNVPASSVAELIGIEPTAYLDLEAGRRSITVDHLVAISRALAVPLAQFLEGIK